MSNDRLAQQLGFILEIDRLKLVLRQTLLTDRSRRENSAEHSWHLAMMAIVLAEYAPAEINLLRVIKMLLIHDLVEIDAGDTFCYDTQGNLNKADRENQAADRLFGLLPPELGADLRSQWEEFEAQSTEDARFAAALDRLQPLLHNWRNGGGTWLQYGITLDRVLERMRPVETGTPALWSLVEDILAESVAKGFLKPAPRDVSIAEVASQG